MSRLLEHRCAAPECGRTYEGPEPYCAECRRQVWAAHIGPDGPYFVAELGEEWPHDLAGGPQCPACGGSEGFERGPGRHHGRDYGCRSCGSFYEVARTATARVVF